MFLDLTNESEVGLTFAGFEVASAGGIIILAILIKVKFSGIPTKSILWTRRLRRLNLVVMFWIIGKLISGLFEFFHLVSDKDQAKSAYDDDFDLFELCCQIIISFISEVLNVLLTLDYAFISIFFEDPQGELPLLTRNSSMIGLNPYIEEKIITIGDNIPTRQNSLGKMFKATFITKTVVYRQIILTNISSYIIEEIQAEVEIYQECNIEGIVNIMGIVLENSKVGFVYPYYEKKSLFHILHNEKITLSYIEKIELLRKIAEILLVVHKENKAHGHLTSYNILIDSNNQPFISDLGFHKLKKYAGIKNNYSYKSAWSSPEILSDSRCTPPQLLPSHDIYSFGMICWETFTEQEPFPGFSIEEIKKTTVDEGARPKIPSELDKDIADLIQSCFNNDSTTRPDMHLLVTSLK